MTAGAVLELDRVGKRYDVHFIGTDTLRGALSQGSWRRPRPVQWAIREVSFSVRRGESVALIGHNGSGKSTLLRLVAGVEQPTCGHLSVRGGVAAVLGLGVGFSDHLSGEQNLEVAGGLLGLGRADLSRLRPAIAEFSQLGPALLRPLREYSSGMVARLGFALAMHAPADLLLIDEVLMVGDEGFRARCLDRVEQFKRSGGSLLFASHEPDLIDRLADRRLELRHGLLQVKAASAPSSPRDHRRKANGSVGGVRTREGVGEIGRPRL
jgi:lipopolysaccharide transport system ATP-binding protein